MQCENVRHVHLFELPSVCSQRFAGNDVPQWLLSNSLAPIPSQKGRLLKAFLRATTSPVDRDTLMPPNSACGESYGRYHVMTHDEPTLAEGDRFYGRYFADRYEQSEGVMQ